jgi:deoxyribonuclease V
MNPLLTNPPDLPGALEDLLAQVPEGRVTTYGLLAKALGDPIASRWVGHHLLHHEHHPECPCHRVVRATGHLGAYIEGDPLRKARRLEVEGLIVDTPPTKAHNKPDAQARVDLKQYAFDAFQGPAPLVEPRRLQQRLTQRVVLQPLPAKPRHVAGVDVSYVGPNLGVACYVEIAPEGGDPLYSQVHQAQVRFPYVSSYLAFRELPLVLELLQAVRKRRPLADVLLVDGSGVLHQRHVGIATHLGIAADVPTIGVTKKRLHGQVSLAPMELGEARPVLDAGNQVGTALQCGARGRRPIFISPGHRIDLSDAQEVVTRLCGTRRLPAPLYWADRLSREAARAMQK